MRTFDLLFRENLNYIIIIDSNSRIAIERADRCLLLHESSPVKGAMRSGEPQLTSFTEGGPRALDCRGNTVAVLHQAGRSTNRQAGLQLGK